MVEFILNDKLIKTPLPKGMLLVDFIRENAGFKGTKTACREGDCGSCTVIEGTPAGKVVKYKAVASCITPLGNVHGKHIVTIEGLSNAEISPIQKALVDSAAIQCGYCTPGIVLALTAYALSNKTYSFNNAKEAIGGNICRCTGYKAIEKALVIITRNLNSINTKNKLKDLIDNGYLPAYFSQIVERLKSIKRPAIKKNAHKIVGGGTDLFVQNPETLYNSELIFYSDIKKLGKISRKDNHFSIGAACKISDLEQYNSFSEKIPRFSEFLALIGSKLIRNMATVAGNIVNASPIGDLSIIFLALDAELFINSAKKQTRQIKLKDFFKEYKSFDLCDNEFIESINFDIPESGFYFNFEKVSKREYLDIASVNSAIGIEIEKDKIKQVHISIGGVAPIPLYLRKTSGFLKGKQVSEETIKGAVEVLLTEISPIDDVRGSSEYKRLLAKQLFFANFIEIFPERFEKSLITKKV
jgi:xanthine dehydrogenase small subunit